MVPVLSIKYDAVNTRYATLEVITAVEEDSDLQGHYAVFLHLTIKALRSVETLITA